MPETEPKPVLPPSLEELEKDLEKDLKFGLKGKVGKPIKLSQIPHTIIKK
jgi:hypothetical protein